MKYLFTFILIFNALYANDTQSSTYCCSNSGFDVSYQNQLNALGDKINDINLNNKLLEQKLVDTEKYYVSILKNQEVLSKNQVDGLKSILEQQEKNHQNTIDNLFYLFHLIVAFFVLVGGTVTYFGKRYLIKKIKKQISEKHIQVTTDLVNGLANEPKFIKVIKAQIYIENDSFKNEDEDEDEITNENENESKTNANKDMLS